MIGLMLLRFGMARVESLFCLCKPDAHLLLRLSIDDDCDDRSDGGKAVASIGVVLVTKCRWSVKIVALSDIIDASEALACSIKSFIKLERLIFVRLCGIVTVVEIVVVLFSSWLVVAFSLCCVCTKNCER